MLGHRRNKTRTSSLNVSIANKQTISLLDYVSSSYYHICQICLGSKIIIENHACSQIEWDLVIVAIIVIVCRPYLCCADFLCRWLRETNGCASVCFDESLQFADEIGYFRIIFNRLAHSLFNGLVRSFHLLYLSLVDKCLRSAVANRQYLLPSHALCDSPTRIDVLFCTLLQCMHTSRSLWLDCVCTTQNTDNTISAHRLNHDLRSAYSSVNNIYVRFFPR